MVDNFLLTSLKDGVKIIKFNRPNKKNAIRTEMYIELTKMLNEDAHNDDVVVTVLTGVGDYYSSGNDISDAVNANADQSFEEATSQKIEMVQKFLAAFIDYPKLLIAIVNGPAVGVAVTTLALCDVVYASNQATFHTPFLNLGLCPEGCSSYMFPRIMGRSIASEMLFLGKKLTAEEAYRFGLVGKVVLHETLDDVFKDVMQYGKLPMNSVKRIKHLIVRNLKDKLHEVNVTEMKQLKECFYSDEMYEALARFANKKSKL